MLIDNEWQENLFSIIIIWYVTVQTGRKSYASGLTMIYLVRLRYYQEWGYAIKIAFSHNSHFKVAEHSFAGGQR